MGKRATDVAAQLKSLEGAGREALKARWVEVFGAPPGFRGHRELLRLILAYRLQENVERALKPRKRRQLQKLAEAHGQRNARPAPSATRLKPGTRLIREWRGKTYIVLVLDEAIEYGGKRYGSLSEIARTITGVRWSGPAFFGLRSNKTSLGQDGPTA
jgi:Protein of unknown function (DUF2924)